MQSLFPRAHRWEAEASLPAHVGGQLVSPLPVEDPCAPQTQPTPGIIIRAGLGAVIQVGKPLCPLPEAEKC